MSTEKIKILVVDDSKLMRLLLGVILAKEPDFEIIGYAEDGEQAFLMTKKLRPDIVTMDILMPGTNGFEATKKIMSECPTPIIILSSLASDSHETESAVKALSLGALQVLSKDFDGSTQGYEDRQKILIENIRVLSKIKMTGFKSLISDKISEIPSYVKAHSLDIVALGVSTGGPEALETIVESLDATYPVPIVIVLHISKGFLSGFVSLLEKKTTLKIAIASNNEELLPGTLYFAPDNYNLLVKKRGAKIYAILDDNAYDELFKPSANRLFASLADNLQGRAAAGLLTGMGSDGAKELLRMKQAGCYTFSQTAKTCVIAGMTSSALKIGAVMKEVDLKYIASFLINLVKK